MSGLLATQGHGDIWAAKGLVSIYGPAAARVWVGVCGACYHQGLCRSLRSGLTLELKLVPKGHAPTRAIQTRVACTATHCHSDFWA